MTAPSSDGHIEDPSRVMLLLGIAGVVGLAGDLLVFSLGKPVAEFTELDIASLVRSLALTALWPLGSNRVRISGRLRLAGIALSFTILIVASIYSVVHYTAQRSTTVQSAPTTSPPRPVSAVRQT